MAVISTFGYKKTREFLLARWYVEEVFCSFAHLLIREQLQISLDEFFHLDFFLWGHVQKTSDEGVAEMSTLVNNRY